MFYLEKNEDARTDLRVDDQIALLKEWFVIFIAVNYINFLSIISQL